MLRVIALLFLALTSSNIQAQSSAPSEWGNTARESSAVIVGTADEVVWVVRPDKMAATMSGNTVVELPNPSEFVVGRVVRMRVNEVIKGAGVVKKGATINIYLPGRLPNEGEPVIQKSQSYLLFLTRLKDNSEEFARTVIYLPGAPSAKKEQFVPRLHYAIVRNANSSALRITAGNRQIVNQVRAAIRSPHR